VWRVLKNVGGGGGEEKPFHPNLITLAEKLGFNVERFSKITGPSNSVR